MRKLCLSAMKTKWIVLGTKLCTIFVLFSCTVMHLSTQNFISNAGNLQNLGKKIDGLISSFWENDTS